MPGATAASIVSPDYPAKKVGAFSAHQLWITPHKPDELYAAGMYVTSTNGLEGLPTWTKENRSIENTDLVGWYTLGFHHVRALRTGRSCRPCGTTSSSVQSTYSTKTP